MQENAPRSITESRLFRLNGKGNGLQAVSAALDAQERRVFSTQDLTRLLHQHRREWGILTDVGPQSFIEFLERELPLKRITLSGPTHEQRFIRFLWRKPSAIEVAASLRSTAYLCHASAVFLHGLSKTVPEILYANYEQSVKEHPQGELTQEALDRAFSNNQRTSTFAFEYGDHKIILLSGKNTSALAVEDVELPGKYSVSVRATSIERTLIDITVRPVYAGGVRKVLEAYKAARVRASVPKLVSVLARLDYVYPYQQAIGFYLERAGYAQNEFTQLKKLGLDYDFYLAHGMEDTKFDEGWRLHYPKTL